MYHCLSSAGHIQFSVCDVWLFTVKITVQNDKQTRLCVIECQEWHWDWCSNWSKFQVQDKWTVRKLPSRWCKHADVFAFWWILWVIMISENLLFLWCHHIDQCLCRIQVYFQMSLLRIYDVVLCVPIYILHERPCPYIVWLDNVPLKAGLIVYYKVW